MRTGTTWNIPPEIAEKYYEWAQNSVHRFFNYGDRPLNTRVDNICCGILAEKAFLELNRQHGLQLKEHQYPDEAHILFEHEKCDLGFDFEGVNQDKFDVKCIPAYGKMVFIKRKKDHLFYPVFRWNKNITSPMTFIGIYKGSDLCPDKLPNSYRI